MRNIICFHMAGFNASEFAETHIVTILNYFQKILLFLHLKYSFLSSIKYIGNQYKKMRNIGILKESKSSGRISSPK